MATMQAKLHPNNAPSRKKKSAWTKMKESRYFYLFFALPFLYFVLFKYGAMFYLGIAFQDYNAFRGIFGSEFVGLKHFEEFISDPYFWQILKNTIVLNLCMLVFYFPCPIILALLINDVKSKHFQKFTQSVTYLPYFLSTVVVCGFITNILASEGLINQIIVALGGEKTTLLMNPAAFRPIYVLSEIWQQAGWGSIIYLAALTGIDSQLYPSLSEEDNDRATTLQSNLNNVFDQEIDKFITGQRSLDEWDDFVATLEAQGASELAEIYNNAYQALQE